LTVKPTPTKPATKAVKKTIEKGGLAKEEKEVSVKECKWCKTGKCWNHGQVPKPGVGGDAAVSVCRFFAKGECKNGDDCSFSHDVDADALAQIDLCVHFAHGKCKKGDECTFNHDFDPKDPEMKKRLRKLECSMRLSSKAYRLWSGQNEYPVPCLTMFGC
jgi:hypothetical protein